MNRRIARGDVVKAMETAGIEQSSLFESTNKDGYKESIGITIDRFSEAVLLFAALGIDSVYNSESSVSDQTLEIREFAKSAYLDALGTGGIMYFPGWELV